MIEIRKFYLSGKLTSDYNGKPQVDGFYPRMASEIVVGAICDWRMLVNKKAWREDYHGIVNFNELRLFFKGEWCAFLMQDFEIEPAKILEMLEAELSNAMQNHEEQKKKTRRGNR